MLNTYSMHIQFVDIFRPTVYLTQPTTECALCAGIHPCRGATVGSGHGADIQLDDMPPSRHSLGRYFSKTSNFINTCMGVLQRVILQSPRLDNDDECLGL